MASWKTLTNWYGNFQIIIYNKTAYYVAYYWTHGHDWKGPMK